jgi:hypothetical protein
LGLYISKEIVERMGGKIEVESMLGRGTLFRITLKTKAKMPRVSFHRSRKGSVGSLILMEEKENITKVIIAEKYQELANLLKKHSDKYEILNVARN